MSANSTNIEASANANNINCENNNYTQQSSTSSNSNNNNNNNIINTNNNNNKNVNCNTEQPQTKRQRIEKTNRKSTLPIKTTEAIKTTTSTSNNSHNNNNNNNNNVPPGPGTISVINTVNSVFNGHSNSINNLNHHYHNHHNNECTTTTTAHSISTPSTTNNSPTSTPSNSRAASLSHLLNVQNLIGISPPSSSSSASSCGTHSSIGSSSSSSGVASTIHSRDECEVAEQKINIVSSNIISSSNSSSSSKNGGGCRNSNNSSSACSSGSDQSADEVDRVTINDLFGTTSPTNIIKTRKLNTTKSQISPASITTTTTACAVTLETTTTTSTKITDQNTIQQIAAAQDMREFEDSLTRQCLCGVSERMLRKPFQSHYSLDSNGQKRIANLNEWPVNKLLQFLSNLQLLFDIYLKQNSKGFICARIMDVCDALIRNDHNLIDEIIVLAGYGNVYVQFLASRVLASFLVIAKQQMDDNWLKKLVDNLFNFERLDALAVQKIHFSLEIIKRIVEWKDVDLHPLEDEIHESTIAAAAVAATTSTSLGASTSAASVTVTMPLTTTTTTTASVTAGAAGIGDLESAHAYMHFHAQQPSLESNYFAVHFRVNEAAAANVVTPNNNNNNRRLVSYADDVDDDDDDEVEEEQVVLSARRQQQQQQQQHHQQNQHHHNLYASQDVSYAQHHVAQRPFSPPTSTYESNVNATSTTTAATSPTTLPGSCHIITLTDSESFDTTHLKCVTIKILENKWPALVKNMSTLIAQHLDVEQSENCILNFLELWENIISVKANLSIVETLPFYAQLDKFESLLNQPQLSCSIYKQMLCLFNEALCYGSTLALQDMLPDETCFLAHQIVRHVKDFRILDSLPRRQPENMVSLLGFKRSPINYVEGSMLATHISTAMVSNSMGDCLEMDKTILQKMVLLVLKSIAVTVKEIRSDSSDSSIDSSDYEAFQDMVLIERSIRDVLRKLENFIKHKLEFHPESHFSKILIHLFDDQDDHLIEAMVCTLDVTAGISFRNNAFHELVTMLNPVYTFLEFLKIISNSSDLLLDLLVSNETCFLLYLLRFLKYIRMNWMMFVQSCHDFGLGAATTLDDAMSVLIRLRLQISRLVSRQLYPYDISPVLRLLESCESLYEGNELS